MMLDAWAFYFCAGLALATAFFLLAEKRGRRLAAILAAILILWRQLDVGGCAPFRRSIEIGSRNVNGRYLHSFLRSQNLGHTH